MAKMQVPDDIWDHIASFISKEALRPLIAVNRPLYNVVMDAEYREVLWAKFDSAMLKSLSRLSYPSTAGRVRRLDVRAWFISYLSNRDALGARVAIKSRNRVSSYFGLSRPTRAPGALSMDSPAEDIFDAMIRAVRLMTSVTEYSFEWRDLPPSKHTLRFLTSTRTTFGLSLRKLTLRAPLSNFPHLISTVDFDSLEELDLHFSYDYSEAQTKEEDNVALICRVIAPFINHFRHSIGSLNISSSSAMDISLLFAGLEKFPKLSKFSLCLAFDAEHLSNPSALFDMLRLHESWLRNVTFRHSFAGSTTADSVARGWNQFSRLLLTEVDSLRGLEYLRIPCLESFSNTLKIVRRSNHTLTELLLVDHFLTEDEAVELIGLFAHRPFDSGLKRLHIGIRWPTHTLFDMLANQLPGLSHLNLVLAQGGCYALVCIPISLRIDSILRYCRHVRVRFSTWSLPCVEVWKIAHIRTGTSLTSEFGRRISAMGTWSPVKETR
ncbi:hypothetical protein C8J57DRAFT_119307 [Mycena rebaudengoi]|nr:hypothetical protein C8J57DRAFT_119307 [Mycena rebaudengoi]